MSSGDTAQCSALAHVVKESEKEWICVYVPLIHFAVHLKLTQHGQSTRLQKKKKMKIEK